MMTILILAGIVILLLIGIASFRKRVNSGCCSPGDADNITVKQIDHDASHYPYQAVVQIAGMHCENCVKKIENAYAEHGCLAEVSLRKKNAVVHMKKRLSNEELIAIPVRAGYDASIKNDSL